ncbi:chemotaxis protein CheW [Pseudohongiella nitratireducens]|uniref:Chemotaxis protein CheW n=1 Tax=Pseudohongiella nitratireducens TaxID=1768907 RepID=A0A917GJT0_9GAMM|nr:chemotaxis protein CheW [Pseudohongiella nitratireducens]GGG48585.1 chemotaxis protein CheW [Pseudohongiella nitratireducens]
MPDSANLGHDVTVKHQNQLVQSYLDSLLSDITEVVAEESVTSTEQERSQRQSIETPPQEINPSSTKAVEASGNVDGAQNQQTGMATTVDMPALQNAGPDQVLSRELQDNADTAIAQAALAVPTQDRLASESEVALESRPGWAEETFASLLFEVAGNDLAAPLHELGGICPLTDNLKFLAGQADWFLGLLNWNGRQLRVVDTAKLLMSETHLENSLEEDYQSVIILGNSNWALAVNRADQSVRLDPQDVKWRTHRGNRRWLAGTLQVQLSSLIDVSALREQLDGMDESLKNVLAEEAGIDPASDR